MYRKLKLQWLNQLVYKYNVVSENKILFEIKKINFQLKRIHPKSSHFVNKWFICPYIWTKCMATFKYQYNAMLNRQYSATLWYGNSSYMLFNKLM